MEVVGGVLEFAGIPGFLANMHVVEQLVDVDTPQVEGFLLELVEVAGRGSAELRTRTAGGWKEIIERSSALRETLPDELSDAFDRIGTSFTRSLGKWFAANKDRRFGDRGVRIEEAGKLRNAILWRLAWDTEPPRRQALNVAASNGLREPLVPSQQRAA